MKTSTYGKLRLAEVIAMAAMATMAFADEADDNWGYGIANFSDTLSVSDQSQRDGSRVIISAATSIEGCNAGLALFEERYICSDRLPSNVVVVPFNGGLFAYTQQYLQSLQASGRSSGTASENHAWAAPGMTGGWAAGYNSDGQSEAGNVGSEGPGTSTAGDGGASSSGGDGGGGGGGP